jgi:sugar phosphate isomerase/epimerase
VHIVGFAQTGAEKLGWTLSVHTVSFVKTHTIEESLDSIKSIGLTKVDTYRGDQHVGDGIEILHYWLDKNKRDKVKELFKDKGMELNHFGVIHGSDEKEWREIFEFAKYMGVKMLISEPQYKHLKLVDKLSQEFDIPVGIHNHPSPTKYWHPSTFMAYAKKLKLSKNIGIYPDITNWLYSGLNPLEMLKLSKGRIIGVQIKDHIDGMGMVPWGTGTVNVPGILNELKSQNFKGNISFEYFGEFS